MLQQDRIFDGGRPDDNPGHPQLIQTPDIVLCPDAPAKLDRDRNLVDDLLQHLEVLGILLVECPVEVDDVEHLSPGIDPLLGDVKRIL